jgi:hypothetical protein
VRQITVFDAATAHMSAMADQHMEAGMLFRSFERLTTAAVLVTVVLMFAVPFVLALVAPFIAR